MEVLSIILNNFPTYYFHDGKVYRKRIEMKDKLGCVVGLAYFDEIKQTGMNLSEINWEDVGREWKSINNPNFYSTVYYDHNHQMLVFTRAFKWYYAMIKHSIPYYGAPYPITTIPEIYQKNIEFRLAVTDFGFIEFCVTYDLASPAIHADLRLHDFPNNADEFLEHLKFGLPAEVDEFCSELVLFYNDLYGCIFPAPSHEDLVTTYSREMEE
jgi:hypothetical protein